MTETGNHWYQVDVRVLEWVHDRGSTEYSWELLRSRKYPEVADLSGLEVDDSLQRLRRDRLILGNRSETSDYYLWTKLELAPEGLRTVGEWPREDEVDVRDVLIEIIRRLDDQAPDAGPPEKRHKARRAIDFIGSLARGAVNDQVRRAGDTLGGELGE